MDSKINKLILGDDDFFDLTSYVKAFEMNAKVGFLDKSETQPGVFTWDYTPTVQTDIDLTLESNFILETLKRNQNTIFHLEQRGKYWFDVHYEADVNMTELQKLQDGSYSATYLGTNIIDHTNHGRLARFLRWLLRR